MPVIVAVLSARIVIGRPRSSQSAGLSSAWIVSPRIDQPIGITKYMTMASAEFMKARPKATPPSMVISSNSV